jgi:glycerol-3-phosphate dehydrogenase
MKRSQTIEQFATHPDQEWDVVVIGGGATGLGAGVDAASRGYKTLVVEQADFAKGTSSRSTKLVHGGVRYLAQGDINLVLEALQERGLMMENVPHLVKNQQFLIPNYDWWDGPFYTVGLKVYDMMAGKLGLGPSVHIDKETTMKNIPNLEDKGLRGGVIYHDGQFDDSRLAISLAQTITDNQGYVINYARVIGLLKDDDGMVCGVKLIDTESGIQYNINAKAVINATGVFVDEINKLDNPGSKPLVVPSQGVHLVLDKSFLQSEYAIMIPKTSDGRVLFAVPWHGKVVVGTTDTLVDKPSLEPRALDEEVDFILTNAAQYLAKDPSRSDVKSVFAGLRPLAAPQDKDEETKEISRSHKLIVSNSGMITIIGGKWTTYRQMGEDIINKAMLIGGLAHKECVTKHMPVHGYVKNIDRHDHLYVYGADIPKLKTIMNANAEAKELLDSRLPYKKVEVIWGVREEMARTVEDILARRTRALLLDAEASMAMAPVVAGIMAAELNHDESWIKSQIKAYMQLASEYLLKN